jgi:hypothetical protein
LVDPCKEMQRNCDGNFLALADVPSRRPIKGLMSMQRSELIKFRDVVNCKSFRNFSLWQAPCVPTAEDWNLDSQSADLGVESQIRGVQLDVAGSGWDWPQRGIPWNYIHIFDLGWVLPVLPGILLDISCEVHCGISCGNILHFFAIILFDLVLGMNFVYIIYIYNYIYICTRYILTFDFTFCPTFSLESILTVYLT